MGFGRPRNITTNSIFLKTRKNDVGNPDKKMQRGEWKKLWEEHRLKNEKKKQDPIRSWRA